MMITMTDKKLEEKIDELDRASEGYYTAIEGRLFKIEQVLAEIKGFLGFQPAGKEILATAPESYVNILHGDNTTEGAVSETDPVIAPSMPYWERVGNNPCISELKEGDSPVKLTAWIDEPFKIIEKDTKTWKGRVANIMLSDGSGTIKMTFFDEQCDQLEKLTKGMEVDVTAWKVSIDKEKVRHILCGKFGSIRPHMQEALE